MIVIGGLDRGNIKKKSVIYINTYSYSIDTHTGFPFFQVVYKYDPSESD